MTSSHLVETFTGINDVPEAPTNSKPGNASHLIEQHNDLAGEVETVSDSVSALTQTVTDNTTASGIVQTALTARMVVAESANLDFENRITNVEAFEARIAALESGGTSTGGGSGGTTTPTDWVKKLELLFEGSNGSSIFTDTKGHSVSAIGNAQISSSYAKFGTSSLYLPNGSTDRLLIAAHEDFAFTGDVKIDFWHYPITDMSGGGGLRLFGGAYNVFESFYGFHGYYNSYFYNFSVLNVQLQFLCSATPLNEWIHLVFQREAGVVSVKRNDVSLSLPSDASSGSLTRVGTIANSAGIAIGDSAPNAGGLPVGYLDNFCIYTK